MTQTDKAPKSAWHPEAREMRQNGATYTAIAEKFKVSVPAAYFAVNPSKRQPTKKKVKVPLQEQMVSDNPLA